jgi:ceramide glucosyltransferase
MMIGEILGGLTFASTGLLLWQWSAASRFPLHRRQSTTTTAVPAVTVLKPLKSADAETANCLASWLQQDYSGPVEFLFGVNEESDPACAIVKELIARFPQHRVHLLICGPPQGANAKVSKLARLAAVARHEFFVVSDADVKAPADLLSQLMPMLTAPQRGLVSCMYALAHPSTAAMQWEAVAVNADFWSQVLQRRDLGPLDFALGAVMAVPRKCVDEIGGFTSLANCLADDYQLGHRIARNGHRVELCPVVVECWSSPMSWRQAWAHQLRWARTIRVCQPLPYALSLLNNVTFWSLLWLAAHPTSRVTLLAATALSLRIISATCLQKQLAPQFFSWRNCWMPWFKDLLQTAIWTTAFLGNKVHWRGADYRVQKDGTLIPSNSQ